MRVWLLSILAAGVIPATAATRNEAGLRKIHDALQANLGNGDVSLTRYNPATLDADKKFAELKQWARDSHGHPRTCRFDFQKGRRNNLELIADENIGLGEELAGILRKLHKDKQIKAFLSATWDSGHDMSENCSVYLYEIFTEDGWHLSITLDYTT